LTGFPQFDPDVGMHLPRIRMILLSSSFGLESSKWTALWDGRKTVISGGNIRRLRSALMESVWTEIRQEQKKGEGAGPSVSVKGYEFTFSRMRR
jgi:hypothetical protein